MKIKKDHHLIVVAVLIVALILVFPIKPQNPIQPEPEGFDYSLFCSYRDLSSPQFLSRIVEGKFNVIMPQFALWRTDNTLRYTHTSVEIDNFINQVKEANPNIQIIVWFGTYPETVLPNLTTAKLRQKCVDAVIKFLNYKSWDGVLDDTEKWIGTDQNQLDYFNACATAVENTGKEYWPWMWPYKMPYVTSQRDAIGAYGGHTWYETEWKNRLDYCQEHADTAFSWILMAEHYLDYPTLSQQLVFLDQKFAEKGESYYSKLDTIGVYWYNSMTDEDWNAWINWVNGKG